VCHKMNVICEARDGLGIVKFKGVFCLQSSLGHRDLCELKSLCSCSYVCVTDSRTVNLNRRCSNSMTNHLERITSGASSQKGNDNDKKCLSDKKTAVRYVLQAR
jgi:hypothetical protein